MNPSHQTHKPEGKGFKPKFGDIDQVQQKLIELKAKLDKSQISDPKGLLSQKVDELEKMYKEIKVNMQQTASNSGQALEEMKRGFIHAWDELMTAADNAKEKFGSSEKQ